MISSNDFEQLFGVKEGIGFLREAKEYKDIDYEEKNNIQYAKNVIAVKAHKNVKPKTIQVNRNYTKWLKSSPFKCIPVSQQIENFIYVNVYLSSKQPIHLQQDEIRTTLSTYLTGMVLTKNYNDMIFHIDVNNDPIDVKIYNINKTSIVSDTTAFHINQSKNITLYYNTKMLTKEVIELKELPPLVELKPEQKILSIDFSKLKVGGLKNELLAISNIIRPYGMKREHLEKINMNEFERGIMLYGSTRIRKNTYCKRIKSIIRCRTICCRQRTRNYE